MTTDKIIEGMQILMKYYDKPDSYHIAAEHDEIFMFGPENTISEEDKARLLELGWSEPESEGDSWHTFV